MNVMQSNISLDRLLSFWPHSVEYTLACTLEPSQLATLIDSCLNRFLPPALFWESTVEDLKGCGPQTLLVPDTLPPEYPEELICLSGQYMPPSDPPDKTSPSTEIAEPEPESVQLQLFTEFANFELGNHISHRLITISGGNWPEKLGWQDASSIPGLTLEHIRIGLEIFHSKPIGWMTLMAPIGDRRLFLEADAQNFRLLLSSEAPWHNRDLPLDNGGLLDRLAAILKELFKFDLKSDYLRLMQQS